MAGGHYARALVAEHQGDAARARTAFDAAVRYWKTADPDLPELQTARNRGSRAGRPSGTARDRLSWSKVKAGVITPVEVRNP